MADVIESQDGVGDEERIKVGEKPVLNRRDTFKYRFVFMEGGKQYSLYSVTNDLHRAQNEHRIRRPDGYVERIGRKTARWKALKWLQMMNRSLA